MACMVSKRCWTCGETYYGNLHSYGDHECGDCAKKKAEEAAHRARGAAEEARQQAWEAAYERGHRDSRLAKEIRDVAEHSVIVRMLCELVAGADPNRPSATQEAKVLKEVKRYWERVRDEIKK